ncbi:YggS family pyridoxal phosphate-dependent enzyme [Allomuricauda sp. SCSIO 65647]|uniref:YggS family pyridoxal phosphate-dependent enzyme n=1 Tax=Allomuricauda sp. SCSIO 65647 TaxID=2908843 RepID=UPI001F1A80A1|nr:YggS family pyridoxal phosphate-dependent enzyme [Muricauda sp. SCSIO 65647]UJH67589.1 YggS family pyridoxal phosphate-dependent enzyme [Muricauda sp. SCSIO 65647]
MSIKANILHIKNSLSDHAALVAVTKTKSTVEILEAYDTGHRVFGENRIQEMTEKWKALPKDIEWHMIGHVQRNKVKYMAEYVSLVHGVDSFRLLKEIDKQAKKYDRVIACLFQMHIAEEDTKFGLDEEELHEILSSAEFKSLENVNIKGLMGMATFTNDENQVRKEFRYLKTIFDNVKERLTDCTILSMGMSGDYKIAIEEGSNMVRIGSSIFGTRNY